MPARLQSSGTRDNLGAPRGAMPVLAPSRPTGCRSGAPMPDGDARVTISAFDDNAALGEAMRDVLEDNEHAVECRSSAAAIDEEPARGMRIEPAARVAE